MADLLKNVQTLRKFINPAQLNVMMQARMTEEGQFPSWKEEKRMYV